MIQTDPPSSQSSADFQSFELSGKLSEDLGSKLKINGSGEEEGDRRHLDRSLEYDGESDRDMDREEREEEEEEEEEFSFASVQSEGSPITADEAFQNGLIRPVYPLFDQTLLFGYEFEYNQDGDVFVPGTENLDLPPPVRKVFVKGRDDDSMANTSEPQGPFCTWSGKTVAEASPESCRKSNSTGFSRLWRFRDLLMRSNSNGKDAFVFINSESTAEEKKKKGKKGKEETAASVHEKLYVRNRAIREEAKRRSYLPYKHVGFFTDVNGLSKNIHPF